MLQEIKTINLSLPFRLGSVNCYLIKTAAGYILVDTGCSNKRRDLEQKLAGAGCLPGNLKAIIITHGDFDHTGNASYLRRKYNSGIAMHREDAGMAEQGDMFYNRKSGHILLRLLIKITSSFIFGFGKAERFEPDFYVDDEFDLTEYGLDARVIRIPGHSRGSIGIITRGGDLFCGDLLTNGDAGDQPNLNAIIDDKAAANASIERLKNLEIGTVYPGHGHPFPVEAFTGNQRESGVIPL